MMLKYSLLLYVFFLLEMDKHLKTLSAINAFHGVKNRVSVQQAVHNSETSSIAEIETQGTYS